MLISKDFLYLCARVRVWVSIYFNYANFIFISHRAYIYIEIECAREREREMDNQKPNLHNMNLKNNKNK